MPYKKVNIGTYMREDGSSSAPPVILNGSKKMIRSQSDNNFSIRSKHAPDYDNLTFNSRVTYIKNEYIAPVPTVFTIPEKESKNIASESIVESSKATKDTSPALLQHLDSNFQAIYKLLQDIDKRMGLLQIDFSKMRLAISTSATPTKVWPTKLKPRSPTPTTPTSGSFFSSSSAAYSIVSSPSPLSSQSDISCPSGSSSSSSSLSASSSSSSSISTSASSSLSSSNTSTTSSTTSYLSSTQASLSGSSDSIFSGSSSSSEVISKSSIVSPASPVVDQPLQSVQDQPLSASVSQTLPANNNQSSVLNASLSWLKYGSYLTAACCLFTPKLNFNISRYTLATFPHGFFIGYGVACASSMIEGVLNGWSNVNASSSQKGFLATTVLTVIGISLWISNINTDMEIVDNIIKCSGAVITFYCGSKFVESVGELLGGTCSNVCGRSHA